MINDVIPRRAVMHAVASGAATMAAARALCPFGVHAAPSAPETIKTVLDHIALTDSAPLIAAKEKGFFADAGIPDVDVLKQASWGGVRGNLVLGAGAGGIDGANILTPPPYLLHTGRVAQKGQAVPMAILARLNVNGQAISVTKDIPGVTLNAAAFKAAVKPDTKLVRRFRGGTHDLCLRYWLAATGIDPHDDVQTIVMPPSQMVANMTVGTMTAFCVGEPWNDQLVHQSIGYTPCVTGEIWRDHPEKSFAMRADWVAKNPRAAVAPTAAVIRAQQWCSESANREAMTEILGHRAWFNVPQGDILPRARGGIDYGDSRKITDSALKNTVLRRSRVVPVSLAQIMVCDRGRALGRAARGYRHTRFGGRGQPRGCLARGGRDRGRGGARRDVARGGDFLRRQEVRSGGPAAYLASQTIKKLS